MACSGAPRPPGDAAPDDPPHRDAAAGAPVDASRDAPRSSDTGTDGAPTDSGSGIALEDYCRRAPDAWCRWLDRCGDGCETALVRADARWCEAAMAAVADGRLGYDATRGERCLDALEAAIADCTDNGPLAGCSPFEGRVPLGEPCYPGHLFGEDECADGAVCAGAADYAGFCPGVCVEGRTVGDLCDDVPCADGYRCFDEICLPLGDVGEDCSVQPCRSELRCQPLSGALRCVVVRPVGETCSPDPTQRCVTGAACVAGRCVDSAPTGTACWDSAQCAATDWCDPSRGICAPRSGEGEPCRGACLVGACVDDGSSPTGRRCHRARTAGQACDPAPCTEGLRCREGTCQPPSTDACATTDECADGLWCDGVACRAPSPEGGPCGLCGPGLFCDGDRCAVQLPNGAPCTANETCGAGADCVDLDGMGPRCRAHQICSGP